MGYSGSGTISTLVGRATFEDAFKVKRKDPQPGGRWR
jgi:hypothetical protein